MTDIYMLFAGLTYYPEGGSEDLAAMFAASGDAEAIDNACRVLDGETHDWRYLVAVDPDTVTCRVVWDPGCFCEASSDTDEEVGR